MYCIKCGKEIPNDADFCCYCGKPQNDKIKQSEVEHIYVNVEGASPSYMRFFVSSINKMIMDDLYVEFKKEFADMSNVTYGLTNGKHALIARPKWHVSYRSFQRCLEALAFIESFFIHKGFRKKIEPNNNVSYEK